MKNTLTLFIFLSFFSILPGQDKFTDTRDGNEYRTITINGTTWMKENLRWKDIPGAHYFDNDPKNVPIYGVLYEWEAAINACPSGWHLPSGNEYRLLSDFFEQKDTWGKGPADPGAFNIQLGGHQDYEGTFSEIDESGYYWTSTEYNKGNAEYFSYLVLINMLLIP